MRVLCVIRIDEGQELGEPPAALFEAMAAFSEECVRNGQLLDEGGLAPTSEAVRVASTGVGSGVDSVSHREVPSISQVAPP